MSKKKSKSITLPEKGIACPRCGEPTEVKVHAAIGERQRRQPFYYSRWFNCANAKCATTLVMRDEFRVFNDAGQGEAVQRIEMVKEQLRPGEALPWD